MSRNEIIELLKDMAGPLGPFRNIESMEDLDKLRTDQYSVIDTKSVDALIDIILNPPGEKERGQISSEDFEFELIEMLTVIGRKDISNFLKKVNELLFWEQSRPVIIDVLGRLRHKESMLVLEKLLLEDLSENEAILIANAVSEIGGLKAKEILEKMKARYPDREAILQEIDICLTNLK